jgi:hypothetical protein
MVRKTSLIKFEAIWVVRLRGQVVIQNMPDIRASNCTLDNVWRKGCSYYRWGEQKSRSVVSNWKIRCSLSCAPKLPKFDGAEFLWGTHRKSCQLSVEVTTEFGTSVVTCMCVIAQTFRHEFENLSLQPLTTSFSRKLTGRLFMYVGIHLYVIIQSSESCVEAPGVNLLSRLDGLSLGLSSRP